MWQQLRIVHYLLTPVSSYGVKFYYLHSPNRVNHMSKQREEDLDTSLSGDENTSPQAGEQRTKWYRRIRKGITTSTAEKKETPEGLWSKCPECNYICTTAELKENLFVCPKCNYHHRIGSEDYYEIIF